MKANNKHEEKRIFEKVLSTKPAQFTLGLDSIVPKVTEVFENLAFSVDNQQ